MVEDDRRQLFRERTHLRRQTIGLGGIHIDEKVELAALELAQRNKVGNAIEKARLAERLDVGCTPGLLAGGGQQTRERNHRAQRIPVRTEMARNEDALGLGKQALCGGVLFPCL